MIRQVARQRYLIDFTLASMMRRKVKNVVLFGVYFLIVFVLASVMLFGSAIRREAALLLANAPEVTVQKLVMGRHDMISGEHLEALSAIRGVRRAEGRLWGYLFDRGNGANYTMMVPPASDTTHAVGPGEAIVGSGIDRVKTIGRNEYLFLIAPSGRFFKFTVKERLPEGSGLVAADLVLISEADYRALFDLPDGVYTDLALSIRNEKEVATILGKAAKAVPNSRFVTRSSIARTYESIFTWREGVLLALLGAAILSFAILAFDKASGLSAEERREIGILKAVGWETSDVLTSKFWEGALISLGAFLIGLIAAYAHVFFFQAGLLEPVLKGWAVLYPDFRLTPHIDPLQVTTLAFFTIVPYTAATIIPIWRAAITDPDTVMR
ncbi:ABC-type lipoprotein release transport system permease subunit [Rhodobium orientis]|uniref:ABC transporter permease n=1 Tax=Rhodobium orientis TaxID=34017 RepID=A0A327JMN9_9HYPH|nr:FtsX-like permease family protein [Rhodobium orientis]MBB4303868.1 ABC-type lipoprotein release transport system permease subunit [Rhodobium orientis]MBK5951415.1 ABC transporter permease [Rhodobium orientis]RAI26122.1 ABC transporter permease [Rhodobium orientis]